MGITKSTDTRVYNINENSPCRYKLVQESHVRCKKDKLPKQYDVWKGTPVADTYAFYSNYEKIVKCPTYSFALKADAGIIRFLGKFNRNSERQDPGHLRSGRHNRAHHKSIPMSG